MYKYECVSYAIMSVSNCVIWQDKPPLHNIVNNYLQTLFHCSSAHDHPSTTITQLTQVQLEEICRLH